MGTVLVLIILAALVGLAVFSLVRKRKSGSSCGCGCGCGGCAMADACRQKRKDTAAK